MKQVAATALILLLLFFLLPFLFIHSGPPGGGTPQATLPIDRTVVSPVPSGPLDTETELKVLLPDGTAETMCMGDYLWRVVAAEMPASFEPEALKAQAVAARTYAMRRIGHAPAAHPDADVCTDHTCCQAYITPEAAAANWGDDAPVYTAKIKAAVADTDGVVARYDGQLIDAVFFSSASSAAVPSSATAVAALSALVFSPSDASALSSKALSMPSSLRSVSLISLPVLFMAVCARFRAICRLSTCLLFSP